MTRGNRNRYGPQQDFSPFVPLVLFIVLCILLVAIGLMREFRKGVPPAAPPQKVEPEKRPALPARGNKFRVALIIDDMGWNREIAKDIEKINRPLTLSFLPKAPYSKIVFDAMKDNDNFELMLHLPMEPEPPAQCFDKGLIKTGMSDEEIAEQFREDIKDFYPHIKGLNNHMGSLFTADERRMRILLAEVRSRNMFFVDSMTTRKSMGYELAKEMGIKTAQRDIFIDNEQNPEYIEKQLRELIETAKTEGTAIAIGHARKTTISVLKRIIPEMEKEGIEIVHASALLE